MDQILRAAARWRRQERADARASAGAREIHGHVDDLVDSIVTRLRSVVRPMPADELDELAHEVVLDVTRFVLAWTESPYDAALATGGSGSRHEG